MKIVPAACFALATVAAASALSVSSSYADSHRDVQSCDSGYLAPDGMGCNFDKQVNRHDSSTARDRSDDHGGRA